MHANRRDIVMNAKVYLRQASSIVMRCRRAGCLSSGSNSRGYLSELPPYIYTITAENPYPSMDTPP